MTCKSLQIWDEETKAMDLRHTSKTVRCVPQGHALQNCCSSETPRLHYLSMQLSHPDEFTSTNLLLREGLRKAGLILLILVYPKLMEGWDSQFSTKSRFRFALATSWANNHWCESGPTCVWGLAFLPVLANKEVCFLVFSLMVVRSRLQATPLWRGHLCQNRSHPHFHITTLDVFWQPLQVIL